MSDFGRMADRVSDLKDDLKDGHKRATENAMEDMGSSVQSQIRANDSVARQQLVTDVRVRSKPSEVLTEQSVSVPGWARYLEHGTGTRGRTDTQPDHKSFDAPSPLPPLDPILTWVIAKNVTSSQYDTKYALAEAIANTIGEAGTFPHPFLRPVWFDSSRGYRHVVRANHRAMKRALRRL